MMMTDSIELNENEADTFFGLPPREKGEMVSESTRDLNQDFDSTGENQVQEGGRRH